MKTLSFELWCMGFRYLFLTHHARILLSHPGVGYLYPSPRLCLRQRYPTLPNYLFMTTTTTVQLNKLPVITIVFRIIDGTIRFITTKYKRTHWFNMCLSWQHLMKPWRSTFVLKCLTYTIFRTYVYSIVSVVCRLEDA